MHDLYMATYRSSVGFTYGWDGERDGPENGAALQRTKPQALFPLPSTQDGAALAPALHPEKRLRLCMPRA